MPRPTAEAVRQTYLEVWRRAYREGEIALTLPTYSQALSLRMALYNAIKPYRDGKMVDVELEAAADACSILLTKGSNELVCTTKMKHGMADLILDQLGLAAAPVATEAQESIDRIFEELNSNKAPANPFYKREE